MYHLGLQHRVYAQTLQPKMVYIMQNLTSRCIYFLISFCQNNVKKIRKYVLLVFFENTDIRQ